MILGVLILAGAFVCVFSTYLLTRFFLRINHDEFNRTPSGATGAGGNNNSDSASVCPPETEGKH